jgi:hypothetical protein
MHMKNVQIGGCMCPLCQFEGNVILGSELETNMEIENKHGK